MKTNIYFLAILFLCLSNVTKAQKNSIGIINEIKNWQRTLNDEYKDKEKSPLADKDLVSFKGHQFFKIDTAFRVNATIVLSNSQEEIPFKTTSDKIKMHTKYADLHFTIKGEPFVLSVYQSKDLMKTKEYADYLFLPFIDATTGEETYGGGRYIDLQLPKSGHSIIIDFNKAYNPYCAYATGFSCPKVPVENELKIKILAGVMYVKSH